MKSSHLFSAIVTVGVIGAAWHYLGASPEGPMLGYSDSGAANETQWEQKFRGGIEAEKIRANMQLLAAYPHHVGTERQHQNALWILNQFKSFGLDAHIEEFETLYPTPKQRLVEMVSPGHYKAQLQEPPIASDPTSGQAGQLPTFVIYSADGDVTAPLVYVNYGGPADYDELAKLGVSVQGKIAIARYGSNWRGIKPKLAAQHGAVGCIIYSDPRDDGYFQGDVYPKGAYRPEQGVQRGSVLQMETEPGDPQTPGWGATPGAKRLPLDQVTTLQKIPVLPISYGDALPLLRALDGPVAPEAWRGALPITYHVGPGGATVHLVAKFNWNTAPLYDVIATIPGSSQPDSWVIRGNHYDAWVNGANDPISGQASLIEEARMLGALVKQGWRPRRTIIYAAWDGEEPGLLGSTEWAETHADELQQKAVLYLNSDDSVAGHLSVSGSHSLEHFLNQVMEQVPDPKTGKPLRDEDIAYQRNRPRTGAAAAASRTITDGEDFRIASLGSGSDYSAYLQHLGIASANLNFAGDQPGGGVYHSIYDDYDWYSRFGDPSFEYERALAQVMGSTVMRFADAGVLPLQFSDFADNMSSIEKEIETTYKAQTGAPGFDFQPLTRSLADLHTAAAAYDKAAADANRQSFEAAGGSLEQTLGHAELALLDPAGLPRRPWYKHQIYAPGYYTGYGVKTMPGLREAIEQKNYEEAAQEETVIVKALDRYTAQIRSAMAALQTRQ